MSNTTMIEEQVSAKTLSVIKEVFSHFDKDDDGVVTTKELGAVVRSVGLNPSEQEIKDMENQIDPDGEGTVDFKDFLPVIVAKLNEPREEEDLREAFRVFDKDGNGLISATDLRIAMTTLGEKMTETEAADMAKFADSDNVGKINYELFIKQMLNDS